MDWLVSPGLYSLLSHTAQAQLPKDGTAHSGLDPSMPTSNQKMSHRQAHRLICKESIP